MPVDRRRQRQARRSTRGSRRRRRRTPRRRRPRASSRPPSAAAPCRRPGRPSASAPVEPWNGASPKANTPPSEATSQYPPVGRVGGDPHDRRSSGRPPIDPVEGGVAEGEHPAVRGHQPVPAAVGGRGQADDRGVERAFRPSSRRTGRRRRRRSRRRRPPASTPRRPAVGTMCSTGALRARPSIDPWYDGCPWAETPPVGVGEPVAGPVTGPRRSRWPGAPSGNGHTEAGATNRRRAPPHR